MKQKKKGNQETAIYSEFRDFNYTQLKNGRLNLVLKGDSFKRGEVTTPWPLTKVDGHLLTTKRQKLFFRGDKGFIDSDDKSFELFGKAEVINDKHKINSEWMYFNSKVNELQGKGDVFSFFKGKLKSEELHVYSDSFKYFTEKRKGDFKGAVNGHINSTRQGKINFSCEQLLFNEQSSDVDFVGDVFIDRGDFEAKALKGHLNLVMGPTKVRNYFLYGDVKLKDFVMTEKGKVKRNAYSEKLVGEIEGKKIILTGFPKVIQGRDLVLGNMITFFENEEVLEVDQSNTSFFMEEDN